MTDEQAKEAAEFFAKRVKTVVELRERTLLDRAERAEKVVAAVRSLLGSNRPTFLTYTERLLYEAIHEYDLTDPVRR